MANVIKMVIQLRRATTAEWLAYKDVVPAAGEPCFDIELNTLKIGDGVKTYEQLEAIGGEGTVSVAADGTSIVLEDGVFKLSGFDAAVTGAQPRKAANGTIEWVVPSTETVDGMHTTIATLQNDVEALQDIVGTPSGGESATLLERIGILETGVDTLNADETIAGSVRKIVKDEINAFANEISDDGTVNTLKELVNYVANHGGEIDTIVADVTLLQQLVGGESVKTQIDTAVAGKVDAEEGKSLVADTLIAKLEAIEEGAQVNKIDEIYVGETLMEIVDKKVVIPVGAGLKTSDEIEIAEDGTLNIKSISFDKVVQSEDSVIVMDGGGANSQTTQN